MRFSVFLAAAVTLGSALVPAALAEEAEADSGFANTCENISFNGPSTLRADCLEANNGQLRSSTIDLNRCVTNSNGNLDCRANGGFAGSCRNCNLQGRSALGCQCRNTQGQYVGTTVNLNNCITNSGGQLTC